MCDDDDDIGIIFDKHDAEFLKFNRVEKPLHPNAKIAGILKAYELFKAANKPFNLEANHDVIYLGWVDGLNITEDDVIELSRYGVHYDEENSCLATFV